MSVPDSSASACAPAPRRSTYPFAIKPVFPAATSTPSSAPLVTPTTGHPSSPLNEVSPSLVPPRPAHGGPKQSPAAADAERKPSEPRFPPRRPTGDRQCTNCGEVDTPQWRGTLCNACALWKRSRGTDRPLPLLFPVRRQPRPRTESPSPSVTPSPSPGLFPSASPPRQGQLRAGGGWAGRRRREWAAQASSSGRALMCERCRVAGMEGGVVAWMGGKGLCARCVEGLRYSHAQHGDERHRIMEHRPPGRAGRSGLGSSPSPRPPYHPDTALFGRPMTPMPTPYRRGRPPPPAHTAGMAPNSHLSPHLSSHPAAHGLPPTPQAGPPGYAGISVGPPYYSPITASSRPQMPPQIAALLARSEASARRRRATMTGSGDSRDRDYTGDRYATTMTQRAERERQPESDRGVSESASEGDNEMAGQGALSGERVSPSPGKRPRDPEGPDEYHSPRPETRRKLSTTPPIGSAEDEWLSKAAFVAGAAWLWEVMDRTRRSFVRIEAEEQRLAARERREAGSIEPPPIKVEGW